MHSKMEGRGREKQILDQGIGRRRMLTLDTRKTVWQRGYPHENRKMIAIDRLVRKINEKGRREIEGERWEER